MIFNRKVEIKMSDCITPLLAPHTSRFTGETL